jgi:ABC-type branched-subunit amino acid transport system ATPase component
MSFSQKRNPSACARALVARSKVLRLDESAASEGTEETA